MEKIARKAIDASGGLGARAAVESPIYVRLLGWQPDERWANLRHMFYDTAKCASEIALLKTSGDPRRLRLEETVAQLQASARELLRELCGPRPSVSR